MNEEEAEETVAGQINLFRFLIKRHSAVRFHEYDFSYT